MVSADWPRRISHQHQKMSDNKKVYFYDANHEDALREAAEQGDVAAAEKILKLDIDPSTADMVKLKMIELSQSHKWPHL